MKLAKLISVLMLLCMAVPLVSATEKYYFEDFDITPNQGIILEEGDIVQFNLLGGEHFIRVKEISRDHTKIRFNVYPFKEAGQAVPFFTLDNVVKVDLNKDGWDDMVFDIDKISEDGRVTLIAVALEQPSEEAPKGQGMVVKDTGSSNYKRTFLFSGLIIIGLIGILAYRKNKSNSEDDNQENSKEE